MFDLTPVTADMISHCACVKRYPDGTGYLYVADAPIFRDSGWVARSKGKHTSVDLDAVEGDSGASDGDKLLDARRKARSRLRDICRSNRFEWFVTFTLDKERIDRYDAPLVLKKLQTWLDNRVRRRGLLYVIVPELHKDGAVHFHGLINGALDADMMASGVVRDGHEVYNLRDWSYGFTACMRLYGDYNAAVGYVCKYIGKSDAKVGGRWYYSGGKLERPVTTPVDVTPEDVSTVDGYSMVIANGIKLKIISLG